MDNVYFGSLTWDNRVFHIFTNKTKIRYRYVQEVSDQKRYESSGEVEIGKSTLGKTKFNKVLKANPDIKDILSSLNFENIDDLCRLCYPKESQGKDGIEGYIFRSASKLKPQSRKAFIAKPFSVNGTKYAGVELKGCGKEGGPIVLDRFRHIGNTAEDTGPEGGLYVDEALKEAENQLKLSRVGKINPLQIATFELPLKVVSPFHGEKQLGLLARGVRSSFRISEIADVSPDIISAINASKKEYSEKLTQNMFQELKSIFEVGYFHDSPTEENVDGTGSITDLAGLKLIKKPEDISYNMRNFTRVANYVWHSISGDYQSNKVFDVINGIFKTEGESIKEISEKIFKSLKK